MKRRQLSAIIARLRQLAAPLVFGGLLFSSGASLSLAQIEGPLAIRVESREVVVPVFVVDKSDIRHVQALLISKDEEIDKEITGLTAKDFRIFEDGVEQKVQSIAVEPLHSWTVLDNVSVHIESSCTPRGIWASPDLWPQTHYVLSSSQQPPLHVYLISYVPPPSAEGSCHQIKVKVNRRPATVSARDEYCNTNSPPSDPMYGTKLGELMQGFADSAEDGKFPVSVQAGSLFGNSAENRVDVSVEFPPSALKREWHGVNLDATVAVLGMVYGKNKALVSRFSDSACYSSKFWTFYRGETSPSRSALKEFEYIMIPSHYETQIDLSPGEYNLKLVVTDGQKFGRVEVPLNVYGFNRTSLAISGIVLSKRYRTVADGPQSAARAPQFVPLVKNGLELTPVSGTRFSKGEQLMTYFEIYEPHAGGTAAAKVQFQMKVIDVKTGELKIDTGLRPVEPGIQPANPVIPIAEQTTINKLPPGAYRLEVQASDSAGERTDWRAASFTVE